MPESRKILLGLAVVTGLTLLLLGVGEFLQSKRLDAPNATGPALSVVELVLREESLRELYTGCLATNGTENYCVRLLGPMAWYPRDAAKCEGIGARVDKVIELGGEPKYQDLYKNERCARLALPHSADAANIGESVGPDGPYAACETTPPYNESDFCTDELGEYRYFPHKERYCPVSKSGVKKFFGRYWKIPLEKRPAPEWIWFFRNERCWRLDKEFHQPEYLR